MNVRKTNVLAARENAAVRLKVALSACPPDLLLGVAHAIEDWDRLDPDDFVRAIAPSRNPIGHRLVDAVVDACGAMIAGPLSRVPADTPEQIAADVFGDVGARALASVHASSCDCPPDLLIRFERCQAEFAGLLRLLADGNKTPEGRPTKR